MNSKGGINWLTILMAPVLIILLIAIFPILDPILNELFSTLDSSSKIHYVNLIKLLTGSIGLILTLGVIWTVIRDLQTPDYVVRK